MQRSNISTRRRFADLEEQIRNRVQNNDYANLVRELYGELREKGAFITGDQAVGLGMAFAKGQMLPFMPTHRNLSDSQLAEAQLVYAGHSKFYKEGADAADNYLQNTTDKDSLTPTRFVWGFQESRWTTWIVKNIQLTL
jgi:hypothetical protein